MVCVQGASEWLTAEEPSDEQTRCHRDVNLSFSLLNKFTALHSGQCGTSLYA